jgi:acetyl-CoA C-acetyltransferase
VLEGRSLSDAPCYGNKQRHLPLNTGKFWGVGDVDLFEINEAFAVVAMAAQKDLGIPREKLNVKVGACALGHPIGATGARLIVTLLHALEAQNLKRGVAALCIGGGEATGIAIERITR